MGDPKLITRVGLIRHGESEAAAEDRFAGAIDVPLSEKGRAQAGKLAARFATESIAAVYSSPLSRTMETARPIAERHGLEVMPQSELREIAHGHWEGMPQSEVAALYAQELARWENDPYTFAPEGGETGLAVTARALPALIAIVEAHRGERVIVISHKATIRLVLCALLGLDPRRYRDRLDQKPGAVNALDFREPGQARLMLFNDTSHDSLPPT